MSSPLVLACLLATLVWAASHAAYGQETMHQHSNPILPGDWSDPGVIRVGEDYYSCRSSFGWQPGIPIAHSRDLIHWRYIGFAFQSLPELAPGDTRGGIWGSDIGFNPNTRQFLIYAPMYRGELLVFHSDRPQGPYEMKTLGQRLGIDPGFFADDDGRLYLAMSTGAIYELARDGLSIARKAHQIDRSRYRLFEGPSIIKRSGWYYLLYSDGGTLPHEPSTISTLRARSIEGPWEEDPDNPVMFATDSNTAFEGPAHGTLIETQNGEWFIIYHAHEPSHYSLGRQTLMQPVEWTDDGWWRAQTGKAPTVMSRAPNLPRADFSLAQSDEFDSPKLGLQWFFTTSPDFTGKAWSLTELPGVLRIRAQAGDLRSISALPGIFQQRVIQKQFSFETRVTFDAAQARESAGLHMFHSPQMNFWLATTVRDGQKRIEVGKYNLGRRTDLWSVPNPHGKTVHLRIDVDGNESASFYFSGDGEQWQRIGDSIYFGASAHHLRDGRRGDPDLGWVGTYKDPSAAELDRGAARHPDLPNQRGNTWTATTFGVFAVRDGADRSQPGDFDYIRVVPGNP